MQRKLRLFLIVVIFLISSSGSGFCASNSSTPQNDCSVSYAEECVLVTTPDGSLLSLGNNEYGQLGDGNSGDFNYKTIDAFSTKPYKVMNNVKMAAAVDYQSYAVKNDNTLWGWGFNHLGVLGIGNQVNKAIPTKIMDNVKFIAPGHALHTLAIKTDNSLWAWGGNSCGQLGDGTTSDRYKPAKLMEHVKYAAVGYEYSAAIKEDGSLWMWGNNCWGNLGDGTKTNRKKPVKIMSNVVSVAASQLETYAIKTDGSLWRWGSSYYSKRQCNLKPVKIMDAVKQVSISSTGHGIVLKKDGTVWTWGKNDHGQLGDGSTKTKDNPIKIMDNAKCISAGWLSSFAIKNDNTLWSWGGNAYGQLGTGDRKGRLKPTQVMNLNTILKSDNCIVPIRVIDGNINDWGDQSPLIVDNENEDYSVDIDIKSADAVIDSNYLYLYAKVTGKQPTVAFSLDYNNDQKTDYLIQYDATQDLTFSFKPDSSGNFKLGPNIPAFAFGDVLEIRVPLNMISSTKNIKLKVDSWVTDSTDPNMRDDVDEWYQIPRSNN